jgi:hypothetical protein
MASPPPGQAQPSFANPRTLSKNGVSHDFLAGRLSANPANESSEISFRGAAARLAKFFERMGASYPFDELNPFRPSGPDSIAVQAGFHVYERDQYPVLRSGEPEDLRAPAARYQTSLQKDYAIVMPPLRDNIRPAAVDDLRDRGLRL